MDDFERAQEQEQKFRDRAIAAQRNRPTEEPDEDDDGTRYCLDCSVVIPQARLDAEKTAVRCITCQNKKERQRG